MSADPADAPALRLRRALPDDAAAIVRLNSDEGMHRGFALRGGAYADVISMARLHPHPPHIAWTGA